jgi:hypothetical protein
MYVKYILIDTVLYLHTVLATGTVVAAARVVTSAAATQSDSSHNLKSARYPPHRRMVQCVLYKLTALIKGFRSL